MNKTLLTSIWIIMVTVCPPIQSRTLDDIEKMTTGLEAGKSIAEVLEKNDFGVLLRKIGENIGPYLGAIGPFISFIATFVQTESEELAYMKKMMKYIDKRFDQMDKRFDSIEKMIKWNVVQVNFGQIEQRIQAMVREFKFLYMVPPLAVENRKKIYIKNYESDYQNSGTKLYQSVLNKQGTFQEDLGTSVLRYTDSDRGKTQLFLRGVMQLLLQAIKIELAYLFSYKYDHNANFMKSHWLNRTHEVQTKFKDIDDQCINVYFSKSKMDIDKYSSKNYGKPNKQFATELNNLLSGKYYWRDWIVVPYSAISGGRWHMMRVTGEHTILRKHGRNLLITSVDKNHPVMDVLSAEQKIQKTKGGWCFRAPGYALNSFHAKVVFDYLDKTGASLVSVAVGTGQFLASSSNSKRLLIYTKCRYYSIVMWG